MSLNLVVRDSERGDAQRAARLLLTHGLITPERPNERAWREVRRYADALSEAFRELCGYTVEVGRRHVRLRRRHDALLPWPVLRRPDDEPFDRRRYALFALSLAALEGGAAQITLSDLATRVRQGAVRLPALDFDPEVHAHRVAFGHALRALTEWGALTVTDGSLEDWERGREDAEALYDVDADRCRALCPLPRTLTDASELLQQDAADIGRDPRRKAQRQRLARALLERPVVYFDDLDAAHRNHLRRDAAALAEDLEALTGARVERRGEGVALVASSAFSDLAFPKGGGDQQAALLLCDRLCALSEDEAMAPRRRPPPAEAVSEDLAFDLDRCAPGAAGMERRSLVAEGEGEGEGARPLLVPFVSDALAFTAAEAVLAQYGTHLPSALRAGPRPLLDAALGVLTAFDLVRLVADGLVLMPALARFRAVSVRAATATSAAAAGPQPQLALFGAPP